MILGSRTDVGRKRVHNEDNLGALRLDLRRDKTRRVDLWTAMVCDGMGGAAGGEVASALAVATIGRSLQEQVMRALLDDGAEFVELRTVLREALWDANRAVFDEARNRIGHTGMGCTATVLVHAAGRVLIGQVGDSRGYHFRGGKLTQVTFDHSFVGELLREGRLTAEEAENHPRKSVITRAIGSRPEVEVDVFDRRAVAGDVYLLCSDGLSGMVADATIEEVLGRLPDDAGEDDLDRTAGVLVEMANEAGGTDNISVVLCRLEHRDIWRQVPDPILLRPLAPDRVLSWTEAADKGIPDVSLQEVPARVRRM